MATIAEYLRNATNQLRMAGVASARLDALILLEDQLKLDRAYLLAHDDAELSPEHFKKLQKNIQRRRSHEPLAYIRGQSEFYGRPYIITKDVLVPRPESEAIITLLSELNPTAITDIGTGSGALAITAALEHPKATVYGVDIAAACLHVAKQNAKQLAATVHFLQGDLFAPLVNISVDTLLCNLPYVPDDYPINQAAQHEPALALFAGADGLDAYRSLITQLTEQQQKPDFIITESLTTQHGSLVEIMKAAGFSLQKTHDLAQLYSRHPKR